ncbi:uncharacterized protein LOC126428012 [Schistocerca serialis cubense]|uniref:uncharacterized protein LOC126428012 n=1 Tax=Schistocerca serialis cubense TaxID=2023355 RepID=UPI00214F04B5|nr:uncharacterized protein LOC126428012 [Schistocerca serialis cubense]
MMKTLLLKLGSLAEMDKPNDDADKETVWHLQQIPLTLCGVRRLLAPQMLKPTVEVQAEATPASFVSPEKPVAYCEEGTPCFSRVSSLSSLASHPAAPDDHRHLVGTAASAQAAVPTGRALHPQETVVEEAKEQRDGACANKVVTFAGAEETPLMFSRCSSLGSLSSFEQHSIHDDRSSVISDFRH